LKIVQINATYDVGGTGRISAAIGELLSKKGIENYILYSLGESKCHNAVKYTNELYTKLMALKSRILGNYGFEAKYATKNMLKILNKIKPDMIHIHNIHSHDCDLEMLFNYIKANNIKTYWTFHDCWSFTGYCPYFDDVKCDKWQSECRNCIQHKKYSWFIDKSNEIFKKKKELFSDLDLTIITPSKWLKSLVEKSIFKNYPVKVISNGIDLSVFKPTESDFRKKYNLENKYVILGVAFGWEKRKGLDVFIELSKKLDDKYKIVLVGADKKIKKILPENIIAINRIANPSELAAVYSAADLFVNPTSEDNYPTVNMEAIACGTPVITSDVGGCSETIFDDCGSVVPVDVELYFKEIIRIAEEKPYLSETCILRAQKYNRNLHYIEYINLFEKNKI